MSTATTKKNIPELRFPGFSDEWIKTIIGNHFEFKNGLNKGKEYFGSGTPIINFTDVYKKTALIKRDIKGTVTLSPSEIARFKVNKGDVFFLRTSETIGEIGLSSVLLESIPECVFSGFVLRARSTTKDLVPGFIRYSYRTLPVRKEIIRKSSMTTRALTNGRLLSGVVFSYPRKKQEQEKIASFFNNLDNLLNNLEKQKKILEEYRRGMMQKIFSQEVRFKDDNGKDFPEWQTKKLGKIFKERIERAKNNNHELLSVTMNNGIRRYDSSVKKDNSSQNKSNYKVVRVGDIAYNTMRMWQGASGVSKFEGIVSPAYTVVTPKNGDSEFFGYLFKMPRVIFNFYRYSQGLVSDTWNLKFKHFSEVEVSVPTSIDEQIKIKNFIKSIDDLICFKSKQIEKAEKWKKGLLQKMFV